MESKACLTFSVVWGGTCPSHFKLAFWFFLDQTDLMQDPAHINNFVFPAMAWRRIVCLASACLHVQVYCPEVGAVITRIQSAEAALTDETFKLHNSSNHLHHLSPALESPETTLTSLNISSAYSESLPLSRTLWAGPTCQERTRRGQAGTGSLAWAQSSGRRRQWHELCRRRCCSLLRIKAPQSG